MEKGPIESQVGKEAAHEVSDRGEPLTYVRGSEWAILTYGP